MTLDEFEATLEPLRAQWRLADPIILIAQIGGNCPVQAEGKIGDEDFYFRARYDSWSMRIGGDDPVSAPAWSYEEAYGESGGYDAGHMPVYEAFQFIGKAVGLYVAHRLSEKAKGEV